MLGIAVSHDLITNADINRGIRRKSFMMSDINGHDSRGKSVFIVTTTTFALTSIFVAARLISRFVILRSRTADDWFIILSWVSYTQKRVR